jgi:thiol-disulfide isomerase/thioredoxin
MMRKIAINILLVFVIILLPFNGINAVENYTVTKISKGFYPDVIDKNQNVLLETFTATWCGWCHYAYEIFDELKKNFGDRIINIRYHNQDSLSMPEVPERAVYYKVSGYPTVLINGDKKIVGADENSYPDYEKAVKEKLNKSPELGIYATGRVYGNKLKLMAEIEQFTDHTLNGNFIALLMESNIEYGKNRFYDFVARKVFPSFSGLKLDFDGKTNFVIDFSFPMDDPQSLRNLKVVLLVQNMETKEIYNSALFEFDSLIINSSVPSTFTDSVPRDLSIKINFSEDLVANAIKRECFKIIASGTKEKIELDFSYERESNSLILTPLKYLKANFSYALIIESLENCLISINKRILKTPYILKFKTSDSPELKLYVDTEIIDFGEVSKIDSPSYTLNIIEEHNNPIKVKLESSKKWIVLSKNEFFSSSESIQVGIDQLFMNVGENEGVISIKTILGTINVKIKANLLSNEYPTIRFYNHIPYAFSEQIIIYGRTDGYRLFLGEEEKSIDLNGYFSVELSLNKGFNIFIFTAMNMQRKQKSEVLLILRLI